MLCMEHPFCIFVRPFERGFEQVQNTGSSVLPHMLRIVLNAGADSFVLV